MEKVCALEKIIADRRITQENLQIATGLSSRVIARYCRGDLTRIDVSTAKVLCQTLAIGMSELFPVYPEVTDSQNNYCPESILDPDLTGLTLNPDIYDDGWR